jgi:VanZ family protein
MNLKTKRYLFYILPPFLYAGIIFLLSSISHYPEAIPRFFCFDKVIHLIEYYVFGYLVMRVFADSPVTVPSRHAVVLTIFVGIFYGIGDEWHQSFVPGRFATVYDVIFDSLGVVLAAFTYRFAVQRLYIVRVIEDRIDRL